MQIKIEKGIPFPGNTSRTSSLGTALKSMKVGDSAVIPRHVQGYMHGAAKRVGVKVKSRKISETDGSNPVSHAGDCAEIRPGSNRIAAE